MADVVYQFRSVGAGDVVRTFEKIGDAAERSAKTAERAMKRQPRTAAAAARQTATATEAAASAQAKVQERSLRAQERALQRSMVKQLHIRQRAALKAAEVEVQAEEKARAQMERRSREKRRERVGMIGGAVRSGVGMAAGAAAVVGGAALRQNVALRDRAITIATQGGGDANQVEKTLRSAAIATPGASSDALAGGMEAFVSKTGRLDMAEKFTGVMAKISVATNTAAEDVGGAMADLFEKFDIKDVGQMEEAMAMLAVQGKRGAFELKDAAAQFPALAAAAQGLGIGKGGEALRRLGAITQIARRGTGSAEQASTAVQSLFAGFATKQTQLKSAGVSVFDKNGQAKDINDLLVDTITKVGGDDLGKKTGALTSIFGQQGIRALNPMLDVFKQGGTIRDKDTGKVTGFDSAKGAEALRAELLKAGDSAGALNEIQRDLGLQQQKTGAQVTAAWEQVRSAMMPLTPVVGRAVASIAALPWDSVAKGLSSLLDVFSVAGDTLENWGKALFEKFGIKPNEDNFEGDPTEVINKGVAKLDELQVERDRITTSLGLGDGFTGPISEEEMARINSTAGGRIDMRRLAEVDEKMVATQQAVDKARAEDSRRGQIASTAMSRDDFVKQFAAAGGQMWEGQGENNAAAIADKIAAGQGMDLGLAGYNAEQQRIADSFGATVQANRTRTDGATEGALPTDQIVGNVNSGVDAIVAALRAKAVEIEGVSVARGNTAFHD